MVLNRKIEDSSLLERPRFKIKQPLMHHVAEVSPLSRNDNKNIGQRWRLASGGTTTTTNKAMTGLPASTIGNISDSAAYLSNSVRMTVPSVTSVQQPTTHQKVRRIIEEHATNQERGKEIRASRPRGHSVSSSSPTNYKIAAVRGELSRRNFTIRETSPLGGNSTRKGRFDFARNELLPSNACDESRPRNRRSNWEKRASNTGENSSWKNSQNFEEISGSLPKSSSVPTNLKSVSGSGVTPVNLNKLTSKTSTNGILRKSTAFLASLTNSRNSGGRKSPGSNLLDPGGKEKSRFTLLRRNTGALSSDFEDDRNLRRSPSCQNLNDAGRKKKNLGVKKSVSFSSDTSFEEKRAPFRKTAVHEAKVYTKGVLRDFNGSEKTTKKVPATWDSASGDSRALLRASREADDRDLLDLISRIRRSGLGGVEVNAMDSSGRTAVSYMAGNGSPAMLEIVLSFADIDANLPDNEGNTPLHFAAQAGQAECLNILLQRCRGIEVDARNILGFTPLMKAALQGRTKCAKILLFAGANPTMRDHGRGLRAEQWARYCGRHVCADVIERFARHKSLEKNIACRWGSEPELATKVLQGKVLPVPAHPIPPTSTGFRSKIKRVFRTTSGPDRSFSLVSQLTNAALCASTPALPKPGEASNNVKSLVRPLSVPQLRVTLAGSQEVLDRTTDKHASSLNEKIENSITKPPRLKKKSK